jgi:uncharacterized protein YndB with AHSA1/START domain
MRSENFIAKAETIINVSADKVWNALVDPDLIREYMFGARVITDWIVGGKITWEGEWQGKPYEDKGVILQIIPQKKLQYSHYSPLAGKEDSPENYHTVTIDLLREEDKTVVSLYQDKNDSEQEKNNSEKNWSVMLAELKKLLEKPR